MRAWVQEGVVELETLQAAWKGVSAKLHTVHYYVEIGLWRCRPIDSFYRRWSKPCVVIRIREIKNYA